MGRPGASASISARARSRKRRPSSSRQNRSWLSASRKIGLMAMAVGTVAVSRWGKIAEGLAADPSTPEYEGWRRRGRAESTNDDRVHSLKQEVIRDGKNPGRDVGGDSQIESSRHGVGDSAAVGPEEERRCNSGGDRC